MKALDEAQASREKTLIYIAALVKMGTPQSVRLHHHCKNDRLLNGALNRTLERT